MPPRSKISGGGHKNRSKAQPPPEFQSQQELSSLDDSTTLMDMKKTLGTLSSALAAITIQVVSLTNNRASQGALLSAQHGTSAAENPPAASSVVFNPNTDEQVRIRIDQ